MKKKIGRCIIIIFTSNKCSVLQEKCNQLKVQFISLLNFAIKKMSNIIRIYIKLYKNASPIGYKRGYNYLL